VVSHFTKDVMIAYLGFAAAQTLANA